MNPATTFDHLFSPQGSGPEDFRSLGVVTFLRAEHVKLEAEALRNSGARFAFLGVPYEEGNVGKPGSVEGPRAMRIASNEYFPYWFEYEVDLQGSCVDCGDVRIPQVDPPTARERIYRAVREILSAGLVPIICGGDHSIAIPASRALSDHLGSERQMGFLQLGAHLNMADSWAGERNTNVNVLARATELPNLRPPHAVQMGARNSFNPKDWTDLAQRRGVRVYSMLEVLDQGVNAAIREAADLVWNGTQSQYLSIDMNVMDASAAPGVTAPEPGGFESREIVQLAQILGERGSIGLIEISELCPVVDVNGTTAKLAVCALLRLLSSQAKARGERVDQALRRPVSAGA